MMTLNQISRKRSLLLIGLNSGTSADGVDMAAVKVVLRGDQVKPLILKSSFKKYNPSLRTRVHEAMWSDRLDLDDLICLDNRLGAFFGEAAREFIKQLKRAKLSVDAVASHGQTIRHLPHARMYAGKKLNGSLQLGSLERIATLTGLPVAGDFRQADIALGNEGAPITVSAMSCFFATPDQSRLIVNIGGIANYFYFPADQSQRQARAADCGPGNSLIDLILKQLLGKPFDRNGRVARNGKINARLLGQLKRHPFFASSAVSTGREEFGAGLAEEIIGSGERLGLTTEDLVATVAELTVTGIVDSIRPIIKRDRTIGKLYLTGGGAHNSFLMLRLRHHLGPVEVTSIEQLGVNPDSLEAAAFAVMGARAFKSLAVPTQFQQTAKQTLYPVLGKIVQPPVRKRQ